MTSEHLFHDAIMQSRGTIFTVIFKKLDGTYRKLNGRLGVHKGLKDPFTETKANPYNPRITVYDVQNKGYRSFYVNRIAELRVRGFKFINYWDIA